MIVGPNSHHRKDETWRPTKMNLPSGFIGKAKKNTGRLQPNNSSNFCPRGKFSHGHGLDGRYGRERMG